ncbi:MAG: hypothetical protein ACLR8Y_02020 [Alistipes indistinctus]
MDEIHYPIPVGFVENVLIRRGLDGDAAYDAATANSAPYQGALADCLWSLVQAINFSEADKSYGALSDKDKERILLRVNKIYNTIGEPAVEAEAQPKVYVGTRL